MRRKVLSKERGRRTISLMLLLTVTLGGVWAVIDTMVPQPWQLRYPVALFALLCPVLLAWHGLFRAQRDRNETETRRVRQREPQAGELAWAPSATWAVPMTSIGLLRRLPQGWVARNSRLPTILRVTALACIALALAGPTTYSEETLSTEGIDIMFVLDMSKSMEEADLQRNRLDAGQRTIREFLGARQGFGDRIGLVVFAKEAMLRCPLTLDYPALESVVAALQIGEVPPLGTALGDALGLALASLRRSDSKSKVVILLSDGDWNQARYMDPLEALELAVSMDVHVFTVLLGKPAARDQRGRYEVNPQVLEKMAQDTNAGFFRAGDDAQLTRSFEEIRKTLEKSESKVVGVTPLAPLFPYLVWPALLLLLLDLTLRMTRWRVLP